jgi:hypothetical protein
MVARLQRDRYGFDYEQEERGACIRMADGRAARAGGSIAEQFETCLFGRCHGLRVAGGTATARGMQACSLQASKV